MKKARKIRNYHQRLMDDNPGGSAAPIPSFVKAQLPLACFTRTGPGVRKALIQVLRTFTPEQLAIVIMKGWDKGLL